MCVGSTPSAPSMPPPPAPLPQAADPAKRVVISSNRNKQRRKAGRSGTVLTGGRGLGGPANTDQKKLLGN